MARLLFPMVQVHCVNHFKVLILLDLDNHSCCFALLPAFILC